MSRFNPFSDHGQMALAGVHFNSAMGRVLAKADQIRATKPATSPLLADAIRRRRVAAMLAKKV